MKKEKVLCPECRKKVSYTIKEVEKVRYVKDKEYSYLTLAAYCNECGNEIFVADIAQKDIQLFDQYYRIVENIITISEINQLMIKYELGKAPLSLALGFGEITITRYLEGQMPSKKYSDIMRNALYNPEYMLELLTKNKDKVNIKNYIRTNDIINHFINLRKPTKKIQSCINYILKEMKEITPLALQKMLYFSQGIHLALYDRELFSDDCEAWVHGPVYPEVYHIYKQYGFNPIEDQFNFFEDKDIDLTENEKEVLDLVIQSFGIYNGKILEEITHKEEPWINARNGIQSIDYSNEIISKESIKKYYKKLYNDYNGFNYEKIIDYINKLI